MVTNFLPHWLLKTFQLQVASEIFHFQPLLWKEPKNTSLNCLGTHPQKILLLLSNPNPPKPWKLILLQHCALCSMLAWKKLVVPFFIQWPRSLCITWWRLLPLLLGKQSNWSQSWTSFDVSYNCSSKEILCKEWQKHNLYTWSPCLMRILLLWFSLLQFFKTFPEIFGLCNFWDNSFSTAIFCPKFSTCLPALLKWPFSSWKWSRDEVSVTPCLLSHWQLLSRRRFAPTV